MLLRCKQSVLRHLLLQFFTQQGLIKRTMQLNRGQQWAKIILFCFLSDQAAFWFFRHNMNERLKCYKAWKLTGHPALHGVERSLVVATGSNGGYWVQLSIQFFISFLTKIICLWVFVCIYVCVSGVCSAYGGQKIPWDWSCRWLLITLQVLATRLCPLKEHQVLLTIAPALQPMRSIFRNCMQVRHHMI